MAESEVAVDELPTLDLIDCILWYVGVTRSFIFMMSGFMFTSEELRKVKIFGCLGEAECACRNT
jgi:hypothetical protein